MRHYPNNRVFNIGAAIASLNFVQLKQIAMSNVRKRRLAYWHILLAVLLIQGSIGAIEARQLIHCHTTYGAECWPWFFLFTFNLPVSLLSAQLVGLISHSGLSFYPELVACFFIYAAVGTLWWSTLLWLAVKLYRRRHAS